MSVFPGRLGRTGTIPLPPRKEEQSIRMTQSISVFGLGYVGTVSAACLAHQKHNVIGVDLSRPKVEAIQAGHSPIVEPGIGQLISETRADGRLQATSNSEYAVLNSEISFLCVGTPSLRNGKLDLGHIEPVCREIGQILKKKPGFHLVVLRSTVLPGTAETVVIPALEASSGKHLGNGFGVCVNPEFMREGTAVSDFLEPSMTIIGASFSFTSGGAFFQSGEILLTLLQSINLTSLLPAPTVAPVAGR